jgi:hypothetical protein
MGEATVEMSATVTETTYPSYPHLRKTATSSQLIVHNKPFLMLAGELHNSSLSSAAFMRTVWANMKAAHINTLLGSISWEMIEPVEGQFNFSFLDEVILDARKYDMHLVLLWFGSFKNALSTYAPGWVKKDVKRFPRVHTLEAGGVMKTLELVSPFCEEGWKADAKAFAALMRHLKEFDGEANTVLMVQVENETGLLGDSRDRSRIANEKFKQAVPKDTLLHLQENYDEKLHPLFKARFPGLKTQVAGEATWEQAFSKLIDAEEMFMADAFSRYVGQVAAAGKAEYPIPFYTNVWLNFDDSAVLDLTNLPVVVGGGEKAGIYPSGGPCPHTMDIWKFNTPALDFIAPDLYFHDYEDVCRNYRHQNQPLFIPEQRRDERGARRVWLAYASYCAIGCSPFGIDSLEADVSPITKHYGLLASISDIVLETQANRPEEMMGFFFDELSEISGPEKPWIGKFGDFELIIERSFVFGKAGPGAGMIIHQGDGKFLLVGWGFQVTFKSTNPKSTFTGILYSEEKEIDKDGKMTTLRIMNGDETRSGSFMIMPNEDPDYGGFPIAVTIPSRTMLAECTAYSVIEDEEDL